jgi:hypothetical protein
MKTILIAGLSLSTMLGLAQPGLSQAKMPAAGKYTFTAWTAAGKKMYTGTFWIIRWKNGENGWITEQGQRTVRALLPERDVNPISGRGYFEGTFMKGTCSFNLHPKYRDHNTTLEGHLTNGKIKGRWGSVTFAGYKQRGTFELVPVKPATKRASNR